MKFAIITGSGLERFKIAGAICVSRHRAGHSVPPHKINYKRLLLGLKKRGATHVVGICAAGSLNRKIKVGDMVMPDQFIDMSGRNLTFFDKEARHTPMAEPFDSRLRFIIASAALWENIKIRRAGTIVTINGPRFSTAAESKMFLKLGGDLVNMTASSECILSNELGLRYAGLAIITDSDFETKELTLEAVQKEARKKSEDIKKILARVADVIGRI